MASSHQNRGLWQQARTPILGLAIVAALGTLGAAGWSLMGDAGGDNVAYVYYTVSRGDLPIVVTERGSLEAQQETTLRNKVETLGDRNRNGTQIIFIVPNGSSAKGPPPPEFVIKLQGNTLEAFSVPDSYNPGSDNPTSEVEVFQIPLSHNTDTIPTEKSIGKEVVDALKDGRMLSELRDQFASIDPNFPQRPYVKTIEPGKQWSVSQPGDLLIELDSAIIRDLIEDQEVEVQQAVSRRIQAESKYNNQIIQNETLLEEAILKVKLADLELKKFRDPTKGDHQLKVEEIQRNIDDQNNKILQARADLELKANNQRGIEALFKLGYKGKGDLDSSRLDFLGGESGLVASMNRLETLQASLDSLQEYDREMQELTLQGKVETANRARKQVENDNVSLLQQALATKEEAIKTAQKQEDRLKRLETQLDYCRVYAPHDGMVVYAREGRRGEVLVAEGATVRERQSLVTLPDLKLMQVKTRVHEAVLDQVRAGLPVTVRIDAFPEEIYRATVHEVAVVPDDSGWGSSVKTYRTIIHLDDEVDNLKPGMTAVCEIHVDRIKDILTIPVQAVVQIESDNWCYVDSENGVERRMLELGLSNDKFVHIKKGLTAGQRVVLNPTAILEEIEQLGNDISPEKGEPELAEGERSETAGKEANEPQKAEAKKSEAPATKRQKDLEKLKAMSPDERKKVIEAMRKKKQAGGSK